MPILIVSVLLSSGLFAFDYYYLPAFNRRQEMLRDQIKARPTRTYYRQDRKWTMGNNFRIYYYKYFDATKKEMADANVYELNPKNFQVMQQIRADRAHWNPTHNTWVFENGWSCEFVNNNCNRKDFTAQTFDEVDETPDFFLQEDLPSEQMNFLQLDKYIRDLKRSGYGYDTMKQDMEIQLYQKFSLPLFALIMAMIGVPFGFMVGNRGALTGIGVSIAIALCYLATSKVFKELGKINELQSGVAAWGPDVIFGLAGLYFLLRMRS